MTTCITLTLMTTCNTSTLMTTRNTSTVMTTTRNGDTSCAYYRAGMITYMAKSSIICGRVVDAACKMK